MRKQFISALFCAVAAAACLWSIRSNAGEKPVVECKDGKCVMSEEDFKRLREFIAKTQEAAEANEQFDVKTMETIQELRAALETCKAYHRQRPVRWDSY